jgi:hypothetical protein
MYFSWERQAPRSGLVQHGFGKSGGPVLRRRICG